ncbi:bifunctional 2-polyprenyl-6-hydroxyphenol methylase/3-demethylubiquinol 3-O-methyltransferase UbiG [Bradyrhizobium sp.]|uniref:class I SAM-dependent methyltransferase n=1 Tax=Bradyrhizobium sp. TaxID=376 RepID=UPI0027324724|nr:class I SAM-dependent methyltransferase [Bradyrhizobium sp.]MDP3075377.1 class I SAM-dependent methyltransferase [Bradyrhizobium sp.]
MNIKSIVQNELVEDPSSVWLLRGHDKFAYSDGVGSEQYLKKVLQRSNDLSTRSDELESCIKDWSSEYHLTTKRAQLLSGFRFDRTMKVLEVGCGCGAITRYLGETFDSVVSVEGSIARARLARLRTRDLTSVSIVCAPFQEIRFSQKFDIIFVIGVFEYSASFVQGDDPYDAVLKYFSDMLTPDGMVVIAIENQFGLKYLNACREDHLGSKFEGVEGYHRRNAGVRTFGKAELELYVKRYFPEVRFFYPYPDYKIPDGVLSTEFLRSGSGGEVVSQMLSRDYSGPNQPLFDEAATILELSRNHALEFFANSFLVIAGRTSLRGVTFDQLALLYSSGRKAEFSTETRILGGADGKWIVSKRSRSGASVVDRGTIRMADTDAPWIPAQSLLTRVALRAKANSATLDEIFAPCRKWVELLVAESSVRSGVALLSGSHVDSIWSNVYLDGQDLRIVDREWIWTDDIPLNVVVVRAIYDFLMRLERVPRFSRALGARRGRALIQGIASAIGVKLIPSDFDNFIALESEFQLIVGSTSKVHQRLYWRLFLIDRSTLRFFVGMLRSFHRYMERAESLSSRVFSKFSARR